MHKFNAFQANNSPNLNNLFLPGYIMYGLMRIGSLLVTQGFQSSGLHQVCRLHPIRDGSDLFINVGLRF